MNTSKITPISERRYEMIPVGSIEILNSRNRDRRQFSNNIRSIEEIGLLKPIVVNGRHYKRRGVYELVCGEGRFLAYKELKKSEIPAEIISCDRKTALLFSLVENIARVPPGTMWFAEEMKRMHDAGFSFRKIASIVGKSDSYVRGYIQLVEQGEQRLIEGVEQGLFSMSFAILVAQSEESSIQNVLMDAFDDGIVNCNNISRVRKVIENRMNWGKKPGAKPNSKVSTYTVKDLKQDITKTTLEKEGFVRETSRKENRLYTLLMGLNTLRQNDSFIELTRRQGLENEPKLQGDYQVGAGE